MLREIVTIDEALCDGCGLCIPSCHEGALRIVNGKARLGADRLCDGLGACLGHCPRGAIRIEKRESEAFDEQAVAVHLDGNVSHQNSNGNGDGHHGGNGRRTSMPSPQPAAAPAFGGCPGSRFAALDVNEAKASEPSPTAAPARSELCHWPVQLRLVPTASSAFHNSRLLVSADCVPLAYPEFHAKLLRDHAVVIACPKLDDTLGYVEKLAEIIQRNNLQEITIAHMQVPCCSGLLTAVLAAREAAGINVPIYDITISLQGEVLQRREIPFVDMASHPEESACCHCAAAKGEH